MAEALEPLAELGLRRERNPLDYLRLTVPQRLFLSDPHMIKLWRDANQLGKSFGVALEAVLTARGTHPFIKVHRPPVEVLVISVSKEQMEPLHRKIWELLPKGELDPRCKFDPGRGITGKPPRIVFASGPGKGSVIHFATYEQGSTRIAGGTFHLVVLDEPPPQSLYGEVVPRVMRMNGRIVIGMTPTPDMPDVSWLREKVAQSKDDQAKGLAGEISEHNYHLTEANVWLEGAPVPLKTRHEIAAFERSLLRHERGMRMRGDWDPVVEGNWLDNFDREKHVRPFQLQDIAAAAAGQPVIICVGYDHGLVPNKEAITVSAFTGDLVDRHEKKVLRNPRAWYMAAEQIDGHATPELAVLKTVELLKKCGLEPRHVDVWVGDRSAKTDKATIDNRQLEHAWAEYLGTTRDELGFSISTAYKPAGSVAAGLTLINGMLARADKRGIPWVMVHPRCVGLARSMAEHKGATKDPLKDLLDAARYPTQRVVRAGEWMSSPITHVVVV